MAAQNDKQQNYHEQQNRKYTMTLRAILEELPPFVSRYFHGVEEVTSIRTRLAYAYDLRVFFNWLYENRPEICQVPMRELTVTVLDKIKRDDILDYLSYCSYYERDGKELSNQERAKSRKLATIRSFYNFFFQSEMIMTNPPSLVKTPKIHEKEIIRLDANEVAILLDQVEEGEKLTKSEAHYHKITRERDLAILTLLLGTGIRVSEFVGLNINDIDYDNDRIKVRRKGGYEAYVYFGDEVREALLVYHEKRKHIVPESGHEEAMFLSLQRRRITVRAVEKLVKKYASRVTTMKNITPHKLRSTYGTNLYRESGDIYLVADVLGHKDVNTTRKHYAAIEEERGRMASKLVHLRKDD